VGYLETIFASTSTDQSVVLHKVLRTKPFRTLLFDPWVKMGVKNSRLGIGCVR
jgi:hypothetical protein